MTAFDRTELDEMVSRWLTANEEAEKAGDPGHSRQPGQSRGPRRGQRRGYSGGHQQWGGLDEGKHQHQIVKDIPGQGTCQDR